MRDAVEEIAGAIERIDDPARLALGAGDVAAFLKAEPPVGARREQFVVKGAFGVAVGLRDEVRRPLAADLKVLDLAEITPQPPACLARGLFHDPDEC